MNGVRLLTPDEYRDAYRYVKQQGSAAQIAEIAGILEPHLVRVKAEQVRTETDRRYPDSNAVKAQRLVDLLASSNNHRSSK